MRNVTFARLEGDKYLIQGGFLAEDHGWIATVTRCSGKIFIPLQTTCLPLRQLVAHDLKYHKFIEKLTVTRNAAVDAKLIELAIARGEQVNADTKWNKWSTIRGGKSKIANLPECPEVVEIPTELMDEDDSVSTGVVTVIFTPVGGSAPKIELADETITRIARTLHAGSHGGDSARGRKRPRLERESWAHPEIRMHTRRNAAHIHYRNADGKVVYHQTRYVKTGDEVVDIATKQRVESFLHDFYVDNHHGAPLDDDVDGVDPPSDLDQGSGDEGSHD